MARHENSADNCVQETKEAKLNNRQNCKRGAKKEDLMRNEGT